MSAEQPTILITGGAGFIGSTLVRQCLWEDDAQVIVLDKLTYAGHRASLAGVADHPHFKLVVGDILDSACVADVLARHAPLSIVHLAAESHVDRSILDPPTFVQTNVQGTCTLLDETTRYWRQLDADRQNSFRFLFASSDEVFGAATADQVFDESSPISPNSPYAASKAAGEQLAQAYGHTFGLPVLVANPTNHYGPRQHPEKLIPRMILNALAGEPLPVYGDGRQQRDWLHVEDGCRALRETLSAGRPGERFVVGSETSRENLHVVEAICDLVDEVIGGSAASRALIKRVADRPGHDRRYAVCTTLIRRRTAWQPQIDFATGLSSTVAWYRDHPDWVAAVNA